MTTEPIVSVDDDDTDAETDEEGPSFLTNGDLRLFGCCMGGGALLALMTGPEGSTETPTSGITGSLWSAHVIGYLIFGALLWVVMTATRKSKNGDWAELAQARTRALAGISNGWDAAIQSRLWRRILGVISFLAALVGALLLATFTGPYTSNKLSISSLRHQLQYCYTYGYLMFAVVLWMLVVLRILERHGVRTPRHGPLDPLRASAVLVGCVLGSIVFALAANPWLPPKFHWSYLTFTTRGTSIWGQWPTYLYLAGGLVLVARIIRRPTHSHRPSGQSRRKRFATPQVSLGFYLAALFVAIEAPKYLAPYWQSIVTQQIGVYCLLALGLNVVVGFSGLLDLGYVAFYAIGAYVAAYLTGALPVLPPTFNLDLFGTHVVNNGVVNLFWVIPFAILAAMFAGVLLGLPTLRVRGDYLAIVTLGFGEIMYVVINNWTGLTAGSQGTNPIPTFYINFLNIHYTWSPVNTLPFYYLLLVFVIGAIVIFSSLNHSRVGRRWAAIREDETAAESVGISGLKYKVMAFAIGASTAGFAGVFTAATTTYLYPQSFVLQLSITILVVVILGGMGSIAGVIAAAVVIQWVPFFLQIHPFLGYQQQDEYIYIGALLVLMMIFRPQGLIPSRRREREIHLAEQGIGTADATGDAVSTMGSNQFESATAIEPMFHGEPE